ncbi:MAG: hypothetical protein LBB84_10310 [Tannerellaceae bacterium]|jgi:hypothetical protein|nr:hypothetical protein [Tannerellaceae bacterium]
MKTINLHCILFLLFISCQGDKKKEDVVRLVTEWQGKKIIFPENTVFTRYLTDTTDYRIPESEYKVLVYVDSVGCTACKLQLSRWKELIAYTDSITGGNIPFLFFLQAKDYREMRYILKSNSFDIPICVDPEDRLNKLNRFPSDVSFQTFLLDKENKVVVVGNPIHNPAVRELYLQQIGRQDYPQDIQTKSSVWVDATNVDMGVFGKSEMKQAVFTLQNIGNTPLVIVDVAVVSVVEKINTAIKTKVLLL